MRYGPPETEDHPTREVNTRPRRRLALIGHHWDEWVQKRLGSRKDWETNGVRSWILCGKRDRRASRVAALDWRRRRTEGQGDPQITQITQICEGQE